MNVERSLLISFLGNYLINTVVVGFAAVIVPPSVSVGLATPRSLVFIGLSAVLVAGLTWWHLISVPRTLKNAIIFGTVGFVVAIVTAFVTGVAGVLAQAGSLSSVMNVLPNFWPFIANWSTLILLGYWVISSALVGFLLQKKVAMPSGEVQNPM